VVVVFDVFGIKGFIIVNIIVVVVVFRKFSVVIYKIRPYSSWLTYEITLMIVKIWLIHDLIH